MEGHIKIDFIYTDGTLNYSDALWLPVDHTYSDQEIEAMKKERFDNWKAFISNPPPAPSDEEVIAMGINVVVTPNEPVTNPSE